MKALIFKGQIVDVSPVAFPVASGLSWVDAPADAKPETHYFDGGAVKVKPGKTQAEIDAEQSAAALATIKKTALDALPDLVAYIAANADAPQKVKDAAGVMDAEKVKVK